MWGTPHFLGWGICGVSFFQTTGSTEKKNIDVGNVSNTTFWSCVLIPTKCSVLTAVFTWIIEVLGKSS